MYSSLQYLECRWFFFIIVIIRQRWWKWKRCLYEWRLWMYEVSVNDWFLERCELLVTIDDNSAGKIWKYFCGRESSLNLNQKSDFGICWLQSGYFGKSITNCCNLALCINFFYECHDLYSVVVGKGECLSYPILAVAAQSQVYTLSGTEVTPFSSCLSVLASTQGIGWG